MAKKPIADQIDAAADALAESAELGAAPVKAKFAKAIEEAKAGAAALGKEISEKAAPYKEKLEGKLSSADLAAEARAIGTQAKERALDLAAEGKSKASDALTSLGKLVAENADVVDEKLGEKYGDYARGAARSIQEAGAKLEAKDLGQLGKDAGDYIKKNPITALAGAAVIGFALAKLLGGGKVAAQDDDAVDEDDI